MLRTSSRASEIVTAIKSCFCAAILRADLPVIPFAMFLSQLRYVRSAVCVGLGSRFSARTSSLGNSCFSTPSSNNWYCGYAGMPAPAIGQITTRSPVESGIPVAPSIWADLQAEAKSASVIPSFAVAQLAISPAVSTANITRRICFPVGSRAITGYSVSVPLGSRLQAPSSAFRSGAVAYAVRWLRGWLRSGPGC